MPGWIGALSLITISPQAVNFAKMPQQPHDVCIPAPLKDTPKRWPLQTPAIQTSLPKKIIAWEVIKLHTATPAGV